MRSGASPATLAWYDRRPSPRTADGQSRLGRTIPFASGTCLAEWPDGLNGPVTLSVTAGGGNGMYSSGLTKKRESDHCEPLKWSDENREITDHPGASVGPLSMASTPTR